MHLSAKHTNICWNSQIINSILITVLFFFFQERRPLLTRLDVVAANVDRAFLPARGQIYSKGCQGAFGCPGDERPGFSFLHLCNGVWELDESIRVQIPGPCSFGGCDPGMWIFNRFPKRLWCCWFASTILKSTLLNHLKEPFWDWRLWSWDRCPRPSNAQNANWFLCKTGTTTKHNYRTSQCAFLLRMGPACSESS